MNPKQLAEDIAASVRARLGQDAPDVENFIAEEIRALLNNSATAAAAATTSTSSSHPMGGGSTERVVVSAHGRNRAGIVAKLTAVISQHEGDIQDISQTIVGNYFTMLIVVDIAGTTQRGTRFSQFKTHLEQTGRDLGVHVVALHDDLLSAMHSV